MMLLHSPSATTTTDSCPFRVTTTSSRLSTTWSQTAANRARKSEYENARTVIVRPLVSEP